MLNRKGGGSFKTAAPPFIFPTGQCPVVPPGGSTGVMPAEDVAATVTYREDSGGSGGTSPTGSSEVGEPGGDGGDSGGGSSGDDPSIPVLPLSPDYDPFLVPQLPPYSGPGPLPGSGAAAVFRT